MTASAFSLSAAIPAESFSVTHGEPIIGALHGPNRHYFCDYCLSWLFTRPDGVDFFVNVRSPMINDSEWVVPFIETYTEEKLSWATTTARHSFAKFPPADMYERLMGEYAEVLSAQPDGG